MLDVIWSKLSKTSKIKIVKLIIEMKKELKSKIWSWLGFVMSIVVFSTMIFLAAICSGCAGDNNAVHKTTKMNNTLSVFEIALIIYGASIIVCILCAKRLKQPIKIVDVRLMFIPIINTILAPFYIIDVLYYSRHIRMIFKYLNTRTFEILNALCNWVNK